MGGAWCAHAPKSQLRSPRLRTGRSNAAGLVAFVNQPLTDAEIEACRLCARKGRPFGDATWTTRIANRLGLHATLRPRGRPRRAADATR